MERTSVGRLPVVGVMGSGQREHIERSEVLGTWLAGLGVHLLTGGGAGVMTAVSRAFASVEERAGHILGVVPCIEDDATTPPAGYPNPWVEIVVRTHLPFSGAQGSGPNSRNHVNVLSADVLVALPGGPGTSSEVGLARRYGRPLVAWIDAPADIPDLPADTPVAAAWEQVEAFVHEHLAAGRRAR